MSHAANSALLDRLRRAHGQLAKIIDMAAEGREDLPLAQQMQAVVASLEKTKTLLVTDHIERHLQALISRFPSETRNELAKLAEYAKYL